jgi:dTDP-4-amino-4,6-dideoxygalactose transaminase
VRVRDRERFVDFLKERGIGTAIHYPVPPHLSGAYAHLGHRRGEFPIAERYADEVLSLPLYNGMTEDEQDYIIDTINSFV